MSIFDLKPILKAWLTTKGYSVDFVESYEEEHYYGGYCETCEYDEWHVNIIFYDIELDRQEYTYYGTYGELVKELEGVWVE